MLGHHLLNGLFSHGGKEKYPPTALNWVLAVPNLIHIYNHHLLNGLFSHGGKEKYPLALNWVFVVPNLIHTYIHNCPDIVVWNKETKQCTIIEISVPLDVNVVTKEIKKNNA